MNVAPSPLSAAEMNARGHAFMAHHGLTGERLWLMACGGDGAGKTYNPRHWQALGGWMNALAARNGVRWLVSTSRRTGRSGEQALRAALKPAHTAYAVWWSIREERMLGDLMGAAERLFVTVDSMSDDQRVHRRGQAPCLGSHRRRQSEPPLSECARQIRAAWPVPQYGHRSTGGHQRTKPATVVHLGGNANRRTRKPDRAVLKRFVARHAKDAEWR